MTNSKLLSVFGSFSIILAILIALFIPEKIIDSSKRLRMWQVLKLIPRYLMNKRFATLIVYILASNSCYRFAGRLIGQHIVKTGFDRGLYTNVEVIIQPLVIVASIIVFRLVVKGRILLLYNISQILRVCLTSVSFLGLLYWENTHNKLNTFLILVGANLFTLSGVPETFAFSFSNLIIDESLGNTGLSIIQAALSISSNVPLTLSLFILKFVNFYYYAIIVLISAGVFLLLLIKPSMLMDKQDISR